MLQESVLVCSRASMEACALVSSGNRCKSAFCRNALCRSVLCRSAFCRNALCKSAGWCLHECILQECSLQECSLEEGSPPASRRARRSLDEGSRRRHHDPLLTPMCSPISLAGSERTRNVGMHDGGQKTQKWGVLNTLFHLYGQTSTTEKTFPIAEPGISGVLTRSRRSKECVITATSPGVITATPPGKATPGHSDAMGLPGKRVRCNHTVPPLKGDIDDEEIHRRRKKLSVLQNPVPRESCVAPILGACFFEPIFPPFIDPFPWASSTPPVPAFLARSAPRLSWGVPLHVSLA